MHCAQEREHGDCRAARCACLSTPEPYPAQASIYPSQRRPASVRRRRHASDVHAG